MPVHLPCTNASAVTLRVFHDKSITAPGVEYKSVVASADTTATEVIERVLERYGETRPPNKFELHYVREDATGKGRRKKSKKSEPLQHTHTQSHQRRHT